MYLWLALAGALVPLISGQSVAPAFRPDSIRTVTGQVLCGSRPAAFLTIEWWVDRGQQVDTLLGSTRSDASGRFQVTSSQDAPANTYLFVRSDCNGPSQPSRFNVNNLTPFNMQLQLRSGSSGGASQISGQLWCGTSPSRFSTVEWWADRGSQVDILLGVGQSDTSGFFSVRRAQTSSSNTYVIVKSNCGGNGKQTRFPVDLRQPNNMQLQLRDSSPGRVSQVSGTILCGRQPAVWQPIEWFLDRGNQFDILLGSSQSDGRGSFILTSTRPVDGRSYLLLKNSCNGRQRTTQVGVNSFNPTNMRIQLQSDGRRSLNSDDSENDFELEDNNRISSLLPFHSEGSAIPKDIEAADLGDYIDVNTMHAIN